jgi:nucleotide-binding universal stress UspA family protein
MENGHTVGGPVIAGVDGSPSSGTTVEAAAREASLRNTTLRLIAALNWPDAEPLVDGVPADPALRDLRAGAERDLATATAAATRTHPGLTVEATIAVSSAADALVAASAHASLVVIGAHGRSAVVSRLIGSTATHVVTHASAPVMVVRGAVPEEGDIVVGSDGSASADAAVGFAFAEAQLRGTGITAVRVWRHPEHTSIGEGEPRIVDDNWAAEERVLAETLAGWNERYPDVAVRREVARGLPGQVLAEASEGGQLVVVGARGEGVVSRLLGSVGETLLYHAHCPTVVVPAVARPM